MEATNYLLLGDCKKELENIPDNTIDAIITDPPYGLSFMGKKWDYDVPSIEIWRECLRVLKPGGHLLSFGGTRTYHRLACNIEDAGFEIRDQIQWLYGSGFPKSHNIKDGDFKGFGTALKPANEPICVARKPLEKGLTVAENVARWGCGAINVDVSRIPGRDRTEYGLKNSIRNNSNIYGTDGTSADFNSNLGRWPANIILDEAAAEILGAPSRFFYVAKASKSERNAGLEGMQKQILATSTGQTRPNKPARLGADPQGVQEPVANHHPTVKPIKLMEYLIRLVTLPKGIVLDPFMGSGTTGIAAKRLGFEFIGIEMNEEYFEIAGKRIGLKHSA